jgi:hypothetical protein
MALHTRRGIYPGFGETGGRSEGVSGIVGDRIVSDRKIGDRRNS